MRAAGLPARVVTGYLGGEINPIGNYLVVRQSEAHAWAEVWLPGQGWRRVDPTAAVSPARIEIGLAAAVTAGEPVPLGLRMDTAWIKNLRYTLDAAANGWNQWVLGYTPARQAQLLSKAGIKEVNWHKLVLLLMVFAGVATGLLAPSLLRDIHFRRAAAAPRLYRRFVRKTARVGLRPRSGEWPLDFAQRVIAANGAWRIPVQTITEHYVNISYGKEENEQRLRALAQAVNRFSP